MKKIFTRTLWAVVLSVLTWVVNTIWYKPFEIRHFYERVFIEFALENPEELTKAGILERYGIKFHNKLLAPVPDLEKRNEQVIRNLDLLMSYKRSEQTKEELLSTEVLKRELEGHIISYSYALYDYPLNHLNGLHLSFPEFMIGYHHIQTLYDARQYLERLNAVAPKIQQSLQNLREHQAQGNLLPKYIAQKVHEQIQRFKTIDAKDNILYLDFVDKVKKSPMIPTHNHSELFYEARSILTEIVYPQFDTLGMYFEELAQSGSEDIGVWRFDDGEAYYTTQLRYYTNTDELFVEDLSEKANREVARIEKNIRKITDRLGYDSQRNMGEILKEIIENPQLRYPKTDEGIDSCLYDFRLLYQKAQQEVGQYLTPNKAPLSITRMPYYKESYSPLFLYRPAPLGSQENAKFQLNLQNPSLFHKFLLPAMVAEELLPGKHLQISSQREINRPTFRKIIQFQAFKEAWACYALYLADEHGFFKEPHHQLGRWYLELLKAVALQVDNGIHYKRWTREQAVDFVRLKTGLDKVEADRIVDEVVIYPAKAWAYLVGLERLKLAKQRFVDKVGKKFTVRKFHELILQEGSMPVDLMVQRIDQFILEIISPNNKRAAAGVLNH